MSRAKDDPLVREALELLDSVARNVGRQIGHRFELDDLKAYAHEAVADLVKRFDPSRGVAFKSWARIRLRGAIIDGLRKDEGTPRGVAARLRALEAADLYVEEKSEEHAAARKAPRDTSMIDARLGAFLRGVATAYATGLVARDDARDDPRNAAESPEEQTARSETRVLLERALDEIGDPEKTILRRHYFLGEDLQEAAAHVGLSKSWGSRLHARGIEKLAERLSKIRHEM